MGSGAIEAVLQHRSLPGRGRSGEIGRETLDNVLPPTNIYCGPEEHICRGTSVFDLLQLLSPPSVIHCVTLRTCKSQYYTCRLAIKGLTPTLPVLKVGDPGVSYFFNMQICLSGFDNLVVLGYWGMSGWLGYLSIRLYLRS